MIEQFPAAPVGMVMPTGANLVIAALNDTLLLAVIIVMARAARKTGSMLPLLCFAGGAASCLMEPIFDVMICVWYPQYGQVPLFRDFDIALPILRGPAMLLAGLVRSAYEGLWLTTIASFVTIGLSVIIAYLTSRLYCEPTQTVATA